MHKLAQYLRRNAETCKTMGPKVGTTENSFRRYLSNTRLPSWEVMDALERVTGGEITPNDFLPIARRRFREQRQRLKQAEQQPIAAE